MSEGTMSEPVVAGHIVHPDVLAEVERQREEIAALAVRVAEQSLELLEVTTERDTLKADLAEEAGVRMRLADLLQRIAVALKGEAPPLRAWSWHDLPEIAAALKARVETQDSTLAMTVARLGGMVEGVPTQRVNFLQRVDELRNLELSLAGYLKPEDGETIQGALVRRFNELATARDQAKARVEELERRSEAPHCELCGPNWYGDCPHTMGLNDAGSDAAALTVLDLVRQAAAAREREARLLKVVEAAVAERQDEIRAGAHTLGLANYPDIEDRLVDSTRQRRVAVDEHLAALRDLDAAGEGR
jgi:hypothetical protein